MQDEYQSMFKELFEEIEVEEVFEDKDIDEMYLLNSQERSTDDAYNRK